VKGDSQLIVKQVKGDCSCNDPELAAYLLHVRMLGKDFKVLDLQHISRVENAVAPVSVPVPDGVLERRLRQPIAWTANPSEGGETSTSKLAVPTVLLLWSPPWVLGITGDSVHPGVQDPEAQVGPDIWITEIWMTTSFPMTWFPLIGLPAGRRGSLPAWRQWCPNVGHYPGGRLRDTCRSSWR
jgi:hypothetical protein